METKILTPLKSRRSYLLLIIVLLFSSTLIPPLLYGQTYTRYTHIDELPEWLLEERASYEFMKGKFIEVYGAEPAGWPEFINKAIIYEKEFRKYKLINYDLRHDIYNKFLTPHDSLLRIKRYDHPELKSVRGYSPFEDTDAKNYQTILSFFYPAINESTREAEPLFRSPINEQTYYGSSDYQDKINTYREAYKREGMLPAILYMFAFDVSPRMLEWYFREVFPVLDHLFKSKSIIDRYKILESVYNHISKLYEHLDIERADAWRSSFGSYAENYDHHYFDDIPETFFLKFRHEQDYNTSSRPKRKELYEKIFYESLRKELSKIEYNVDCIIQNWDGKNYKGKAKLLYDMDHKQSNGGLISYGLHIDKSVYTNSYLERNNHSIYGHFPHFNISLNVLYHERLPSHFVMLSPEDYELEHFVWSTYSIKGETSDDMFYNEDSEKRIFWMSEEMMAYIDYPKTLYDDLQEPYFKALKVAADEYYKCKSIVPEIYGMEYKRAVSYRYQIHAETDSNEIFPDGESGVNIVASVSKYNQYDESEFEMVDGVSLNFEIVEHRNYKGGRLSATAADTDYNGTAKIRYSSPTLEELRDVDKEARTAVTIRVSNKELNLEETVIINLKGDRGTAEALPAAGVISDHAIVPPDKRYPALIKFRYEDENLMPIKGKEILFSLRSEPAHAALKAVTPGATPISKHKVRAITDDMGYAMVQYLYTSDDKPEQAITDIIEIESPRSLTPFIAKVSVGMNIVFETVENSYEGKGVISAGERIPLRVKIKDAWHPDLDLMPVIDYWGGGKLEGETPLRVKLEVERLGSVPDYLLDHLQIKRYPTEKAFAENMRVRSFKDKNQMNMLWMSQASLLNYQGYPCVQPQIAGTSYYELRVTLTDALGNDVFPINHPASKAFITLTTGVDADHFKIFINLNPFGPHSVFTKTLREALGYKYGTVVSIADALDAINRGDVEGLYKILFDEIRGAIFDELKKVGPVAKESVDAYSKVAFAEKITFDIMQDKSGPLAQMDDAIFNKLKEVFSSSPGQIVVLSGDGKQRLKVEAKKEKSGKMKEILSRETIELNRETLRAIKEGVSDVVLQIKGATTVPVKEKEFVTHKRMKTLSYKNGNTIIYLIPDNFKVIPENYTYYKKY